MISAVSRVVNMAADLLPVSSAAGKCISTVLNLQSLGLFSPLYILLTYHFVTYLLTYLLAYYIIALIFVLLYENF